MYGIPYPHIETITGFKRKLAAVSERCYQSIWPSYSIFGRKELLIRYNPELGFRMVRLVQASMIFYLNY